MTDESVDHQVATAGRASEADEAPIVVEEGVPCVLVLDRALQEVVALLEETHMAGTPTFLEVAPVLVVAPEAETMTETVVGAEADPRLLLDRLGQDRSILGAGTRRSDLGRDRGQDLIIDVTERTDTGGMSSEALVETRAQCRQADLRQRNADDTHLRGVALHADVGDLLVIHQVLRGLEVGGAVETPLAKVNATDRRNDVEEVSPLAARMKVVDPGDGDRHHRQPDARGGVKAPAAAGAIAHQPPHSPEYVNRQLMYWKVNASPQNEWGLPTKARPQLRWVRHKSAKRDGSNHYCDTNRGRNFNRKSQQRTKLAP